MTTANTLLGSRRRGPTGAETARRPRGSYRRQLTTTSSDAGADARRAAAVILEVLAGLRTPADAAVVLGIRPQGYYLFEQRAVQGLVAACAPRPRGRTVSAEGRLAQLQRELAVARRDLARHQALARTAQRALGLTAAPQASKVQAPSTAKKRRQRKPAIRGLRAARLLRAGLLPGGRAAQEVELVPAGPGVPGSASGRSRPSGTESTGSPGGSGHGGASHGRPKAVEHP